MNSPLVVVLIVIAILLVIGRFEAFCLRNLADTPDVELRHLTRGGWYAVILFMIPLGGVAYLYLGRAR